MYKFIDKICKIIISNRNINFPYKDYDEDYAGFSLGDLLRFVYGTVVSK